MIIIENKSLRYRSIDKIGIDEKLVGGRKREDMYLGFLINDSLKACVQVLQ